MTKQKKINIIKYWLQSFGDKDNEGFCFEFYVKDVRHSFHLQYNFDEDGMEMEPSCQFNIGDKMSSASIYQRTEEELNRAIIFMFNLKSYH